MKEPKPKPKKRDQLIAELATVTHDRDEWKSAVTNRDNRDEKLRQRFSTVLDSHREIYTINKNTYSWEEIFFEVGKLSQDQFHIRFDDRLKTAESQILNLQSNRYTTSAL